MPGYIVTFKEGITDEQYEAAKKRTIDQGGEISHEYSLGFKGFSVEFPEDSIQVLESIEHVKHVEKDEGVRTQ